MESVNFYDRDGNSITPERWHELYGDVRNRFVVRTRIEGDRLLVVLWNGAQDSSNEVKLYSAWLMTGHRFEEHLGHYDTEAEAMAAHGDFAATIGQRFFCPRCWFASSNIEDLRHGYCGRCEQVTGPTWEQRQGPA